MKAEAVAKFLEENEEMLTDLTEEERSIILKHVGWWDLYESDSCRFSLAEAIYWYAAHCHGGQWSHLYRVLSTSEFRPGLMCNGPEEGKAQELYDDLCRLVEV